ncbi:MAG TPA: formylmethanofuran dehydrogenase subunit B [Clostridia bacterium]|nr:formylmethanofuran dehydrogenase subunit B [Clostridia bacterium]
MEGVACTFCGCVCDDIRVTVRQNEVIGVERACTLGRAYLMRPQHGEGVTTPRVNGKEVSLECALAEASSILSRSKYPLIFGLSNTTIEAQKVAVRLAELIGASIDSTSSVCHGPGTLAKQYIGEPTSSLGEVMNRADLVIFWGSNPAESHPRHMSRYSVMRPGLYVPRGRKDRTVVVVDVRKTPSARAADLFLRIEPWSDYRILSNLIRLVKLTPVHELTPVHGSHVHWSQIEALKECSDESGEDREGRLPTPDTLQRLASLMTSCRYGALFYGVGLTMSRGGMMNVTAALRLVRELNNFTRFVIIPMRGHGNVAGIDNVLAWRTGYPFAVNFSRGFPRFGPGEFSAVDLLCRGEPDAVVVIAADPVSSLPVSAAEHLKRVPTVVIDPYVSPTTEIASVVLPCAKAGISASGTYYRMDNVPVPLKRLVASVYPSDEEILGSIVARIESAMTGRREVDAR